MNNNFTKRMLWRLTKTQILKWCVIFLVVVTPVLYFVKIGAYETLENVEHSSARSLFMNVSELRLEHADTIQQRILSRRAVLKNNENILWVDGNSSFLARITDYNSAISQERQKLVDAGATSRKWRDFEFPHKEIWGNDNDTIYLIGGVEGVATVALKWAAIDSSGHPEITTSMWSSTTLMWSFQLDHRNVLLQEYYQWIASEPLCTWISSGLTKAKYDSVYMSCNTDPLQTLNKIPMDVVYFNMKPIQLISTYNFPGEYYVVPPEYVFYMHIAQNATVQRYGDIVIDSMMISHYTCLHSTLKSGTTTGAKEKYPVYDEVFVISQYWGAGYFHMMCESMPRVAPYLEFLHNHPSIRVHVISTRGRTAELLGILGISADRLVSGIVRGKLVYLPQGTYCGFTHVQMAQLLALRYRQYIDSHFPQAVRNSVVVIHRSDKRRFVYHKTIESDISQLAAKYGFRYELFSDKPTPGLEHTMQMFRRAVLVVEPHGAGLSNLLFAEPGTYVVEGVCNRPHVNLCYQRLAHLLGMHYHAVPARGSPVSAHCQELIDIHPDTMHSVVQMYMDLIKHGNFTAIS